jgi:hypothetical protein
MEELLFFHRTGEAGNMEAGIPGAGSFTRSF